MLSNLHHTVNSETIVTAQSESAVLNDIIKYINENSDRKLDTQILSDKFFVSRSWIDHEFKKILKTSSKKYINQKKVLYAQSLILDGYPPKTWLQCVITKIILLFTVNT